MTRGLLLGAVLVATIAATPAMAQSGNPIRLEPYFGAFEDAYDISPDGRNTGVLAGLRLAYTVAERVRLVGNFGFAETQDVTNPSGLTSYWVYDNTWAFTTAGAEFDAIAGPTSVSVGMLIGAGWRRNDLTGQVGEPDPVTEVYSAGGFAAMDVVTPGITLRRELTPRTALVLMAQDQIFDFLEGPVDHSPSISFGFSVR